MRASSDGRPGARRRRLLLPLAVVLVAACTSSPSATSPSPVAVTPTAGQATAVPTSSAAPTPSSPGVTSTPTPENTAAPTPTPSPTTKPSAGSWKRGGALDIGQLSGPPIALSDGQVLVTGTVFESTTPLAALWDPSDRQWHPTAALPARRTQASIVPLRDGGALVAGGFNGRHASYSSAYVFDASAGTWSKVGGMHTARAAAAAAVLPDGRVLVAGGYFYVEPVATVQTAQLAVAVPAPTPDPMRLDDVTVPPHGYALATAELFDPRTGTWSDTGPMRYARVGAAAVTLADGRVLVFGSSGEEVERVDARAFSNAEIYDPATGRFASAGRLPAIDVDALNEPGKNPIPSGDPAQGLVGSLVALADGGAVLVGHGGWWKHAGDISRSFRMDPGGSWRQIGPTWLVVGEPTRNLLVGPATRDLTTAAVTGLSGDRVLAAGGYDLTITTQGWRTDPSSKASVFDAASDRWWPAPPLPEPVDSASAVTLPDGSALVFDGWSNDEMGTPQSGSFRFVPAAP